MGSPPYSALLPSQNEQDGSGKGWKETQLTQRAGLEWHSIPDDVMFSNKCWGKGPEKGENEYLYRHLKLITLIVNL